ncbi:hypothetical protein BC830DRAFT_942532 [Chytriomyces sp. MP71]|nr:hypothetical protein BC830DRAFT_942532 [Chytriomyces sp. MP71]
MNGERFQGLKLKLMTSSQLAQTYNSWSSVTATVDSFSVGQSTDALVAWSSQASKTAWRVKFDPSSLHNSPESDSQQLAVKSTSWDSPPRKQSPFFTGAHWERSLIVDPGSGKLSAGSASSASKWAPGSETSSSKTISPTLHVSNSGLGVKDVSWNFNSQQHATQQQPSDGVEAPRGVHLMNEAFSHAASPPFTSPANLDFSMSGREGTPRGASLWEIPERPIGPPLPTPATSWESSAAHRFENSVEFPGYRGGVGRIDNPSASMAYNDRRMDPKLIAQSMAMESVMNFNQQIMNGALHAGATGPMGSGFSGPPLPPRRNSFASKPSSDSFGVPSGGVGGVGGEFDAWNSFGPRRGSLPHISDGYIGADASTMAPYPAKVVSYPQQQQQSVQRPQSLQAWNQPHQPAILGTQKSIFISQNNIW